MCPLHLSYSNSIRRKLETVHETLETPDSVCSWDSAKRRLSVFPRTFHGFRLIPKRVLYQFSV